MFFASERRMHLGLLIVRLGLAVPLLIRAVPMLSGGAVLWARAARDFHMLNAGLPPSVVGLTVLILQTLSALSLITGYFFRIAAVVLACLFAVYLLNFTGAGFRTLPFYAVTHVCLCAGLMLTGPGRFVIAVKLEQK